MSRCRGSCSLNLYVSACLRGGYRSFFCRSSVVMPGLPSCPVEQVRRESRPRRETRGAVRAHQREGGASGGERCNRTGKGAGARGRAGRPETNRGVPKTRCADHQGAVNGCHGSSGRCPPPARAHGSLCTGAGSLPHSHRNTLSRLAALRHGLMAVTITGPAANLLGACAVHGQESSKCPSNG